jgi:hypothetical protein
MKKQFNDVSSKYGAPMGRWTGTELEHNEKLRLFKVVLNQGYDDGGAYWGERMNGNSLYCLQGRNFQQFYDAKSRKQAYEIALKDFSNIQLIKKV